MDVARVEIKDADALVRCPKPHDIIEGSTEITAMDDARHKFICLDCGGRWEGGKIMLRQ